LPRCTTTKACGDRRRSSTTTCGTKQQPATRSASSCRRANPISKLPRPSTLRPRSALPDSRRCGHATQHNYLASSAWRANRLTCRRRAGLRRDRLMRNRSAHTPSPRPQDAVCDPQGPEHRRAAPLHYPAAASGCGAPSSYSPPRTAARSARARARALFNRFNVHVQ